MQDEPAARAPAHTDPRAEFIASLARRVETLRDALAALRAEPFQRGRRENFLRRAHAMSAAARVLGFPTVADQLAHVENTLGQSGETTAPEFNELDEILRALPRLASGGDEVSPESEAVPDLRDASGSLPLSILVFGDPALAGAFETRPGEPAMECAVVEDAQKLSELARAIGPDAVVLDGADSRIVSVVTRLSRDPLIEPMPVVVVGLSNKKLQPEVLAAGAALVLERPISDASLREHVVRLTRPKDTEIELPLGPLSLSRLADWCADVVREGIAGASRSPATTTTVELGDGHEVMAAIWGAVARVHDFVTRKSEGKIRFDPIGPGGSVAVARWADPDARVGSRSFASASEPPGVNLDGRTVVVVDDDPAVVWFLAGVLRNAGAKVIECHEGEKALEAVRASWPDLVISDVLMPKLDGLSLCREVKQDVAVRDVPVILISWKEDLLQRLRELGAEADAYLRKEVESSSVVQRARVVMRRRARVEQRLAASGEVRGRLDGLSPRLVLELVGKTRPDSNLVVYDAVHRYEVRLRGGTPVYAARTRAERPTETGLGVLAALLGVSAGRFVVRSDSGPTTRDFSGSLREVLAEPILRARTAQRELRAERLVRVEKVELDRSQVEPYLEAAPGAATDLLRRMLDGRSPQELILEGASPLVLAAALQDVARRGAVLSVSVRPLSKPAPVSDAVASEPEKPTTLAPEDYTDTNDMKEPSEVPAADAAPVFTFELFPTGSQPPVDAAEEAQWEDLARSLEDADEVADEPTAALVRKPIAPEAASEDRTSEPIDLAHAVLGLGGSPEPPPIRPSPMISPRHDEGGPTGRAKVEAEAPHGPATRLAIPRPARTSTLAGPGPTRLDLPRARTGGTRPRVESAPEVRGVFDSHEAPSAPHAERPKLADLRGSEPPSPVAADEERKPEPQQATEPADEHGTEARGEAVLVRERAKSAEGSFDEARSAIADEARSDEMAADGGTQAGKVLGREPRGGGPREERRPRPPIDSEEPELSPSPASEIGSSLGEEPSALARVKLGLATAASFAFMFFAVRYFLAPEAPPNVEVPEDPSLQVAETPAPVPTPAAAETALPVIQSGLDLAPDTPLPEGKGLLEVVTSGRHFIYVDDVFVGRGPRRLVTLDPGAHRVQIRLSGEPKAFELSVDPGRRTLLTAPE